MARHGLPLIPFVSVWWNHPARNTMTEWRKLSASLQPNSSHGIRAGAARFGQWWWLVGSAGLVSSWQNEPIYNPAVGERGYKKKQLATVNFDKVLCAAICYVGQCRCANCTGTLETLICIMSMQGLSQKVRCDSVRATSQLQEHHGTLMGEICPFFWYEHIIPDASACHSNTVSFRLPPNGDSNLYPGPLDRPLIVLLTSMGWCAGCKPR